MTDTVSIASRKSVGPKLEWLYEPHMRTTTVCVAVARGSRDDPPNRPGAAHLFEHLVMSATGAGLSLVNGIDRRGGIANASTGNEATLYFARVENGDAVELARSLWRAVDDPRVTSEDLEREREVVLQELSAAEADPADAVQDAFLEALFDGHPLGRPVGGSRGGVAPFSLEDVASYQGATASRPRQVVLVGGLAPDAIDSLLGDDARSPVSPLPDAASQPPDAPAAAGAVSQSRWPQTEEFCWFAAGGVAVPRGDDLVAAFEVLASLLGSNASSLLYRALRDDHRIAYAFTSWASAYSDAGAFRTLVGVEPANGPTAVGVVESLLERMATRGPRKEELAVAIRQTVGALLRDAEDPIQCAIDVALNTNVGQLPWNRDRARKAVQAVTPEDVRRSAAMVLDSFRVVIRPGVAA